MNLPSKELLSEVLGVKIIEHFIDNEIYSYHDEYFYQDINVYHLANKCKEWAVKSNKEDKSINNGDHFHINYIGSAHIGYFENYKCDVGYRGMNKNKTFRDLNKVFTADTEPEVIFKSCEWILENKDKI